MKAVVATQFGAPDVLTYTDIDQPQAGPGQVLIKVEAYSVNFSDIKTRRGSKGNGKVPYVPGIDAAGVITEVGENVHGLTVGQRVIAFPKGGAYAEYAVAPANLTFPISEKIDFLTAAAAPIASFTAYQLLADVARIQAGETVLVHAASGGVGTTAIQFAKLLGAGKVIGTVSRDEKAAVVLEAGADHVINRSAEDFAKKTLEYTNGIGVNIILDSIAAEVTEKSLDLPGDVRKNCTLWQCRGKKRVDSNERPSCKLPVYTRLQLWDCKKAQAGTCTACCVTNYSLSGRKAFKHDGWPYI